MHVLHGHYKQVQYAGMHAQIGVNLFGCFLQVFGSCTEALGYAFQVGLGFEDADRKGSVNNIGYFEQILISVFHDAFSVLKHFLFQLLVFQNQSTRIPFHF